MDGLIRLQGYLGRDKHNTTRPAVDSIRTINNRKLGQSYVVGESTYLTAFFDVKKCNFKLIKKQFPQYDRKGALDDYIIVYGHLHSRSPLLQWDLYCEYKGHVSARNCNLSEEELSKSKHLEESLNLRQRHLQLLSDDCGAFVFEIKSIVGAPFRKSWSEPIARGGRNHGKSMGDNLKLLGIRRFMPYISWSQIDLQKVRFKIAKYGEADSQGFNNLHKLNNVKLKQLMRTVTGRGRTQRLRDFPNYKFYGNRILEAARYHAKSDLYCEILSNFLPGYGQYLRDEPDLLQSLKSHFKGECEQSPEEDGEVKPRRSDPVDVVFYGAFAACWKKQPRQDQVEDTLKHWMIFRPDLKVRLEGWEQRFEAWKTVYNWKQWYGDTAFEVTKIKKGFNHCEPPAWLLRLDSSCFGGKLYTFPYDYSIANAFVDLVAKSSYSFVRGELSSQGQLPVGGKHEPLYLIPRQGLLRLMPDFVKNNYCLYETPNEYFMETLHLVETPVTEIHQRSNGTCVFMGMEYWSLDVVVFLLTRLQGYSFVFHWMGWDLLGSTIKSSYRLTPTLMSLSAMPEVEVVELPSFDSSAAEYEPKTIQEMVDIVQESWSEISTLDQKGVDHGMQIVCCSREDQDLAEVEFKRQVENDLLFYLGDRVITKCGMIDHIVGIKVRGRSVESVEREQYLASFITLKYGDRVYHPTELRLATVLNHTDVLFPLGNVVLYGAVPDYVRQQYEDYLCTKKLIKHPTTFKSKEEVLNLNAVMEKNRGNPLPCVVYNVLQQRAKEREKKELIAYQKRKAQRNEELKEALKKRRLQEA